MGAELSLWVQPRHFGRGFGLPLLPRKRPNCCVTAGVTAVQLRKASTTAGAR